MDVALSTFNTVEGQETVMKTQLSQTQLDFLGNYNFIVDLFCKGCKCKCQEK